MKKLVLLGVGLWMGWVHLAAQPGGAAGGPPSAARIQGLVQDAASGEPLEYATVTLIRAQDSVLAGGGLTDSEGAFTLDNLKPGQFYIRVEYLGYSRKLIGPVRLGPPPAGDGWELRLGEIALEAMGMEADEVEITASRSFAVQSIDKKSYDAGQVIAAQGGTVLDVLNNIPSVSVDMEGGVSLRGSQNVTVLIDGKPSGLTGANLQSLQANLIESIEVITNPSAKYDPDGTAGIINIILKKNRQRGSGGTFSAGAGSRNKYNSGLQLFYNQGKWGFSGNYSFRYDDRRIRRESYREVFSPDGSTAYDQLTLGNFISWNHTAQAGIDFNPDARNSLSLRGVYSQGPRDRRDSTDYETLLPDGALTDRFRRSSIELETDVNVDVTAAYRRTFGSPRHTLGLDATYSLNDEVEDNDLVNRYFNPDGTPSGVPDLFESILTPSRVTNTTLQADYVRPVGSKGVLEAGGKSILRSNDTDLRYFSWNTGASLWELDPVRSNHFRYADQIHSLYASYAGERNKWAFKAGLRAEQTFLEGNLITTGETIRNQFFNLFPSAYLGYSLSESSQLLFNYSRRINRPRIQMLNPFNDVSDPFNIRRGNPELQPEYVSSVEAGYNQAFSKWSFTGNLYFRDTRNAFTRFVDVDSNGVATTFMVNLGSNRSYGADVTFNSTPVSWLSLTWNINGFRNDVDASNLDADLSNGAWVANTRLNATVKLPHSIDLQLTGNYNSPRNTPQGISIATRSLDLSARMRVLKNAGTLALSCTDIFNTLYFGNEAESDAFVQRFTFKRETRVLLLNFTYRFGKVMEQRRRNGREDGRQDDGGGMGDF
ncbi:MAG: TonB-dependent receptor [Bacteroidia bacterium]|nr:TonB-dependent receptor [Bacteroidia bacterium]